MLQNYDLIGSIKTHEGFKEYPYIDPVIAAYPQLIGISEEEMVLIKKYFDKLKVTFGIGFTFITLDEANMVLHNRIQTTKLRLHNRIEGFINQPKVIQDVLTEMAYQMGIDGLLKFKETLKYCKQRNYVKMSEEMLDSDWAREETPERAKELSNIVKLVAT